MNFNDLAKESYTTESYLLLYFTFCNLGIFDQEEADATELYAKLNVINYKSIVWSAPSGTSVQL